MIRCLLLCVWLGLVAGCSSAVRWVPDYHVVRQGETLFSIADRYDLDHKQLARWNRLGDGTLIYPGQRLSLKGPVAGPATAGSGRSSTGGRSSQSTPPPVQKVGDWSWPTNGPVLAAYGSSAKTQSGIQIGGRQGQEIKAASGGEVVYAGSGLQSYGQLVIIKHNASFLSAYGHNQTLLVKEGDRVSRGQRIAKMGQGPGAKPLLHFEIRRNGDPVDPIRYLPRR